MGRKSREKRERLRNVSSALSAADSVAGLPTDQRQAFHAFLEAFPGESCAASRPAISSLRFEETEMRHLRAEDFTGEAQQTAFLQRWDEHPEARAFLADGLPALIFDLGGLRVMIRFFEDGKEERSGVVE